MSVEFLFVAILIYTFLIINGTEENRYIFNESTNNLIVKSTTGRNYTVKNSDTFDGKELLLIPKFEKQPEITKDFSNQTNVPLFLNLIINLNFVNEKDTKSKKYKKPRAKTRRDTKTDIAKLPPMETVNFDVGERTKSMNSENLGNIFEKIKLRMELQRKKRNVGYQNNEGAKTRQNSTNDKHNKIQDIFKEEFPKMALLNEDKEVDVTRWLKNWKDILAVNPILSSERPTKPEVEYIDEWKYSYRVTLYNSEAYNVSNFLCSGILVSSQWVLTSVFCKLGNDVTLLIGVHTLPKKISSHNRYGVLKKVYSLSENLELIQMDRPVQWSFKAPDIRALKMEEIEILMRKGKCGLLSWMPVDIEKGIFELRQYPRLMLQSENRKNRKKNSIRVYPLDPYGSSKKDTGSPVLCDDVMTGILLNADEDVMIVELLCPVLEWITFFTREGSYFEVTARKFTIRSVAVSLRSQVGYFPYLLVMCSGWVKV